MDMFKWLNPDQKCVNMVQDTLYEIVSLNFVQIIEGATRFWPGKENSMLDQCWTNSPEKIRSKRMLSAQQETITS